MTLDTFFEKFALFADAPDAVGKMRELVLRLATNGHLIPTDGLGWIKAPLIEVATARMGKTILKNELSTSGIPVYSAGRENAAWGFIAASDLTFRTGTIVVSARGTIGFPKIPAEPEFISTQTTIAITPTCKEIYSGYLCLQLQTVDWGALTAKTAIPMITVKQVHAIEVRYPHSLDEQKRIVAKVDELMALCDRLEAQQQERKQQHTALSRASLARFADAPTPANLQLLFHKSYTIPPADLRKSILTLAVQGKLVAQDPGDEPPQLPDGAQNIEDSEWVSRLQLPALWNWTRLESILAILKNGFNGKPSKVPGKFKVTRIETIARETIDLTRVGYADDLPGDIVAKHAISKGDILFSHINSEPHLGKTAICTIDDPMLIHGVNLLLIRPIAGVDSRYLNIAFRELRASSYFVSIAQRAVNQASINQKNLGKTAIPIPPLAEQRRIVAKVEQLMALVDDLESQLAASRTTATKLLSALVAELTKS
jgi:type I restriction enzyme S subunit